MRNRFACLAAGAVALSLALGACGSNDDGGGGGSTHANAAKAADIMIADVPKSVNNPYFTTASRGAQAAARELGSGYKMVGPSNSEATSQLPYINTLAQQHVDAVMMSSNDADAPVPAVERAVQQGVKFVTYDADMNGGRSIFVNQATPQSVAETQVRLISEQIGGRGEVAILSGTSTATGQNVWVGIMRETFKKPEYAGLRLVKVAYGDTDTQKSTQETLGLLAQYPNLRGIIVPDAVGLPAAARVVKSKGKVDQVKLTGLSLPSLMRQYIKDGTVENFGLWNVEDMGYLAYEAAYNLATGRITGREGETFTAGKLGRYTVGRGGEVVLGPLLVFDRRNIDDYQF